MEKANEEENTIKKSSPPKNNENNIQNENTNAPPSLPQKPKQSYSLSVKEFINLYNHLHMLNADNMNLEIYSKDIIRLFENITESIINGNKNDPEIFEHFSKLNFISDIITLMRRNNKIVNIQIIKFFSVIMTNINDNYLHYFLYNCDFINQQIFESSEKIDGEYLYYYINFVKSLILKINLKTIGFFFHVQTYSFPLLNNCLKFYNHPDTMISNTIRNIILCIMKIKHKDSIDYMCSMPMISYFIFISCRLRDEIKTLNKKLQRNKTEDCLFLEEKIIDDIMYLQDIFSINIEKVNYILINSIFHFLILPVICKALVEKSIENQSAYIDSSDDSIKNKPKRKSILDTLFNKDTKEKTTPKNFISSGLALYILNLLIYYIKNEHFLNSLACLLFMPKLHYKLIKKAKSQSVDLDNYEGDYNIKPKKVYFRHYIKQNFDLNMFKVNLDYPNKKYIELQKLQIRTKEKCNNGNMRFNVSYPEVLQYALEILNNFFTNLEIKEIREYHDIISEATGIQCGISYHKNTKCFLNLMHKTMNYIKNNEKEFENDVINNNDNTKYVNNEIYYSLSTLFKDSNDLFLLLSSMLFHQIINNEIVSVNFLGNIKFLRADLILKNKNGENKNLNSNNEIKCEIIKNEKIDDEDIKLNGTNFVNYLYLIRNFISNDKKIYNLINNESLSYYFKNIQVKYNYNLVGLLVSYLNREDTLKPEVYLFLIKLIYDLINYAPGKFLEIENLHKSIIQKAFTKTVEFIKNSIKSGFVNDNDVFKIFEFLFLKKSKYFLDDYDILLKSICKDCLFLANKEKTSDIAGNIINCENFEMFNSFIICDFHLRTKIYLLKCLYELYGELFDKKSVEFKGLEGVKMGNEEGRQILKERLAENLDKLIK